MLFSYRIAGMNHCLTVIESLCLFERGENYMDKSGQYFVGNTGNAVLFMDGGFCSTKPCPQQYRP